MLQNKEQDDAQKYFCLNKKLGLGLGPDNPAGKTRMQNYVGPYLDIYCFSVFLFPFEISILGFFFRCFGI